MNFRTNNKSCIVRMSVSGTEGVTFINFLTAGGLKGNHFLPCTIHSCFDDVKFFVIIFLLQLYFNAILLPICPIVIIMKLLSPP